MSQDQQPDRKAAPQITAAQVVDYLKRHPDFLARHPEALEHQQAPRRVLGAGVVDFQSALIDQLREDAAGQTLRHRELIDTSRANLSIQAQVHECVLVLLEATSFEQVIQTVATDFAVLLDLDVAILCIETEGDRWAGGETLQGLRIVDRGVVDAVLGPDESMVLKSAVAADPAVFGAAAGLVRSAALVRLEISPATPPAMLAFGSRDPEKFHPGQATELIGFLATALESVVRGWLTLTD